jgi:hypothetical protein
MSEQTAGGPERGEGPKAAQQEWLHRAQEAARGQDVRAMLVAFLHSGVIDSIKRRLGYAWRNVHPDDIDQQVCEALDHFYDRVKGGKWSGT